jgi:hypothetical protein
MNEKLTQMMVRARQLEKEGMTVAEIASALGCSQRAAVGLLAKNTGPIVRSKTTEGVTMLNAFRAAKSPDFVLSPKHNFGKFLFSSIIGYGATQLGERTYVAALMWNRARTNNGTPPTE